MTTRTHPTLLSPGRLALVPALIITALLVGACANGGDDALRPATTAEDAPAPGLALEGPAARDPVAEGRCRPGGRA